MLGDNAVADALETTGPGTGWLPLVPAREGMALDNTFEVFDVDKVHVLLEAVAGSKPFR